MANPPSIPASSPHDLRRRLLSAAAERENDAQKRALYWLALGHLESSLERQSAATKAYLKAYNEAPGFRPPLYELVRIFEQRRSMTNLHRLYDAELRSSTTAEDKASAAADLSGFLEDHEEIAADAISTIQDALEEATGGPGMATLGLYLERLAVRAGDASLRIEALKARAEAASDPEWSALLQLDLAELIASAGDSQSQREAVEILERITELDIDRTRIFRAMERIARAHHLPAVLVKALHGRAYAQLAKTEEPNPSESDAPESETTSAADHALAAALLFESSSVRLRELDDPEAALTDLQEASGLVPNDPLISRALLETAHRAGNAALVRELVSDLVRADSEEQRSAESKEEEALARFYLAHAERSAGNQKQALEELTRASSLLPSSRALRATLDAWFLDSGEYEEWLAALEARESDDAGRDRWLAAWLALYGLKDFGKAKPLFQQAAEHHSKPGPILEELRHAAFVHGDNETEREAIDALLPTLSDPADREAMLHRKVELIAEHDPASLSETLKKTLRLESESRWGEQILRVHAARSGDLENLMVAHQALADRADRLGNMEEGAAHLAALGRAALRAGKKSDAIGALEKALEWVPGHTYAVSLLESLYRETGQGDKAVALLREAAEAQSGGTAASMGLLFAAASAEASDDYDLAIETCRQVANAAPEDPSGWLALRRLAKKRGDAELEREALEAISELERAPESLVFELADSRASAGDVEGFETIFQRAIQGSQSLAAAVSALVFARSREIQRRALEVIAENAMSAEDRTLAEDALRHLVHSDESFSGAENRSNVPPGAQEQDPNLGDSDNIERPSESSLPSGALPALVHRLLDHDPSAEDWLELAEHAQGEDAAELRLAAIRMMLLGEERDAAEDAFLLAQELGFDAAETCAAAVALSETVSLGDDPDAQADALLARAPFASDIDGPGMRAAAARSLSQAARPEAIESLQELLERDPDDLASWEALRVAARHARAWPLLVRACDRLASELDGEFAHPLLEEAAAVQMDYLGDFDGAEARLRRVTEEAPDRPIAYFRLRDLLVERKADAELLDLVSRRSESEKDPSQLIRLRYERARLLRAIPDVAGALDALESLFEIDPQHAGGLAMAVEIHVGRRAWADAVSKLDALSAADVPDSQKRVANLGAADFLEKKLDDAAGARQRLQNVAQLGLADIKVHRRIAELSAQIGEAGVQVEALQAAAELAEGDERTQLLRDSAKIQEESGERDGALLTLSIAQQARPTDLSIATQTHDLLRGDSRAVGHARTFEATVRDALARDGLTADLLRGLRAAAQWQSDDALAHRALDLLIASGEANEEEIDEANEQTFLIGGALSPNQVAEFLVVGDEGDFATASKMVQESLLQLDGVDAGSFALNKEAAGADAYTAELASIAGMFAFETQALRVQSVRDPFRLVPQRRGLTWVRDSSAPAAGSAAMRFWAVREAFAFSRGTAWWLRNPHPENALGALRAVAGKGSSVDAALEKKIAKALPRRVKKSLATLAFEGDVQKYVSAARTSSNCAGAAIGRDLKAALEGLLQGRVSLSGLRADTPAGDLARAWIAPSRAKGAQK